MSHSQPIDISQEELISCVEHGLRNDEIAEKYFISVSSVQRQLKKHGVYRTRKVYDKGMYLRMLELGLREEQIARVFDTTVRALRTWRSRHKL